MQALFRAPRALQILAGLLLAALLGLLPARATAQALGTVPVSLSAVEPDTGSLNVQVVIDFGAPTQVELFGAFTIVVQSGNPVAGTACGPGVDYINRGRQTFGVPPGSTTRILPVVICGDTRPDGNFELLLLLEDLGGPQSIFCGERCVTVIRVRDNDGPAPATLSIGSASVAEPPTSATTSIARPRITLSQAVAGPVSVRVRTVDGTATAPIDYLPVDTVVTIPAGSLSLSIEVPVQIRNEGPFSIEPSSEAFTVQLSAPSGAVLGNATGTVRIIDAGFTVGTPDFSLAEPLRAGADQVLSLGWTLTDNRPWRQLATVDVRLRGARSQGEFLRWDEATNTMAVCRKGYGPQGDDDDDDRVTRHGAVCGPARPLGQPGRLTLGRQLDVDLASTRVVGSGPTGSFARLELAVRLREAMGGKQVTLLMGAADDAGNEDRFTPLARLQIRR